MILWADSFDHYGDIETNMTDGAYASATGFLSTTVARTGTRSFALPGNTDLRRVFGGAKTTVGLGGAFFWGVLPPGNEQHSIAKFCDFANIPNVTISLETTGIIAVWRGGNAAGDAYTTKIGSSGVPVITAAAWNHIEAKVLIHNSAGTVEVRVNGVTVINLTGQDTQASGGAAETSQVRWEVTGAANPGYFVDDVIAWDDSGSLNNDFVGDKKVLTDFPDADTGDVDWARSTGSSNFGVIDENPPNGDTDYLETSNVADVFGVTFPDLPAEVSQIAAIIMVHKIRKTDAGDANYQSHVISNGDTADGVDRPVTTAYTLYHDVFELDPDTAALWTRTAAQAAAYQGERTL